MSRAGALVLVVLVVLAGVVVVVLAVLGAIDKNDADRRPQPVGTVPAPSTEVVADATNVERGMHFGLDGRVLTVQLLPPVRNQTFETVSGARISATCGRRRVIRGARPRSPGAGRPARRARATASRATSRGGAGSRTSPAASSRS
jgi:hypothetical protein